MEIHPGVGGLHWPLVTGYYSGCFGHALTLGPSAHVEPPLLHSIQEQGQRSGKATAWRTSVLGGALLGKAGFY